MGERKLYRVVGIVRDPNRVEKHVTTELYARDESDAGHRGELALEKSSGRGVSDVGVEEVAEPPEPKTRRW
ncbi:hypothetical protein ACFV1L_10600 [Kitasatospora sp. NPDC059646]|uniref:hypothetical protein n=1 Tax=Kitasatospora sp. NPDC059646 TaxID=3346893 RepID=UPI0036C9B599